MAARELYVGLGLPWTLSPVVSGLEEDSFLGEEWDRKGNDGVVEDFFELALGTGSPFTRWREANPEKVGTKKDVVRVIRRLRGCLWIKRK